MGDKKDALLGEFRAYLRILKSVHSGADLNASAQAAGGALPGSVKGYLGYVVNHQQDNQILPLIENAVEARVELQEALAGNRCMPHSICEALHSPSKQPVHQHAATWPWPVLSSCNNNEDHCTLAVLQNKKSRACPKLQQGKAIFRCKASQTACLQTCHVSRTETGPAFATGACLSCSRNSCCPPDRGFVVDQVEMRQPISGSSVA